MTQTGSKSAWTRRGFLKASGTAALSVPYVLTSDALGAAGRAAASERIVMGAIGTGGRGTGDMRGLLGFGEVQMTAVCDVVGPHRYRAKKYVDDKYGNTDCTVHLDFREILGRDDIDAVMIGTPDHWHAIVACWAMKSGKDVFCEKPETLTVRDGRVMTETARKYGAVFAGGSQRVWGDYNWYHRMVWGGTIGEPKEAWVNVGGPSGRCTLPAEPTPDDVNWDLWLGRSPWRPFHPSLIRGGFRPWRDYSGGGMTDWGCHTFGGALFCLKLHETGPVEVIPPDGKDHERLTYVFANGMRIYHGGAWGSRMSFRGTEGECPRRDGRRETPPNVHIPNYKGRGGLLGDFVHCVKTRERPFRDIEIAHRTATHCHIGNIAYWLKRPLKWDPVAEQFVGDDEANRWLDRPMREPWRI